MLLNVNIACIALVEGNIYFCHRSGMQNIINIRLLVNMQKNRVTCTQKRQYWVVLWKDFQIICMTFIMILMNQQNAKVKIRQELLPVSR